MIFGQIHRITNLCSEKKDRRHFINMFYNRLLYRGYKRDDILPIFSKAILHYNNRTDITTPTVTPPYRDDPSIPWRQIYLHIRYHPQNTLAYKYQEVWRDVFGNPKHGRKLSSLKNNAGVRINIDRMVVAHSRPLNLGNKLSYCKLDVHTGPMD